MHFPFFYLERYWSSLSFVMNCFVVRVRCAPLLRGSALSQQQLCPDKPALRPSLSETGSVHATAGLVKDQLVVLYVRQQLAHNLMGKSAPISFHNFFVLDIDTTHAVYSTGIYKGVWNRY
jgi:hypothetical protein